MIKFVENNKTISDSKKNYFYNNIIFPMTNAHYIIVSEYSHKAKVFRNFDRQLKKYPNVYYDKSISRKFVKLHRKTFGLLLHFNSIIICLYNKIR